MKSDNHTMRVGVYIEKQSAYEVTCNNCPWNREIEKSSGPQALVTFIPDTNLHSCDQRYTQSGIKIIGETSRNGIPVCANIFALIKEGVFDQIQAQKLLSEARKATIKTKDDGIKTA